MGVTIPQFDSLAQGLGYANVPMPTSDASDTYGLSSSQGEKDSTNPVPTVTVMSLETKDTNAPLAGAFLESNLHPDNWLNPEKPIF